MEKQDLKIGDVVILKSGSPTMTFTAFNDEHAWVTYYNQANNEMVKDFILPLQTLIKVS